MSTSWAHYKELETDAKKRKEEQDKIERQKLRDAAATQLTADEQQAFDQLGNEQILADSMNVSRRVLRRWRFDRYFERRTGRLDSAPAREPRNQFDMRFKPRPDPLPNT